MFQMDTYNSLKMDHREIILDIQCFKDNSNSFIVKEVCAIELDSGILLFHHIVSPPYERKQLSAGKLRESYWTTKYHHGIEWNVGDISYNSMMDKLEYLFSSCLSIYVKGSEKKQYIKSLCPEYCQVLDLETLNCESLESLSVLYVNDSLRCKYHTSENHNCALANALNLRKWYIANKK